MIRHLTPPLFFLSGFFLLALFVADEAAAQRLLGNLNYTPPTRLGPIGYSLDSNRKTKVVPPAEIIPSDPSLGSSDLNAGGKSRFQVRQTTSKGTVITSTAPFLSEEGLTESKTGTKTVAQGETYAAHPEPIIIPADADGPVVTSSEMNGSTLVLSDADGGRFAPSDSSGLLVLTPELNGGGFTSSDFGTADAALPPLSSGGEMNGYGGVSPYSTEGGGGELADFFLLPTVDHEGCFRSAVGSVEYIPNVGTLKSGMTTFRGGARFAFPVPDGDHPLFITPDFSWTDFTMPEYLQPEIGEKVGLYSTGLFVEYLCPVSDCFLIDARVGLHWNSDFKASSGDALRITGRGVGIWKMSPFSRLILGASYQDLSDWNIIPTAGISWKPSEDFYFDALFPSPKIARRITWMKGLKEIEEGDSPYWIYLAGEYEGNRSVFKPDGPSGAKMGKEATMTYYDFRLFLGMEKRLAGDINWALEGGLVFARHLEFERFSAGGSSGTIEEKPKAAGLARLKIRF